MASQQFGPAARARRSRLVVEGQNFPTSGSFYRLAHHSGISARLERRPLPILDFDDGLALAPQAEPPCPALTAPAAPAARRRAVLRQPHTSYALYAGHVSSKF
jgi:hypothetical protein